VRREDVRKAYEAAVGERTDNAFTAVLGRVRAKLATLGVALHRLSGGRLLLEVGSSPIRSSAETCRKQLHANLPPIETRIGGCE
jgi:hypothetical protein